MNRQPVISSNIASVGYDPEAQTLEIEFHSSAVYQYYNVPENIYKDLLKAPSPGKYLLENIKENYHYRRMDR